MSFIHSVLTKLDARGAQRPAALAAMPALITSSNGASRRLMVMAVVGVALMGFVAFADWPNWLRSARAASPPAASVQATVQPAPVAERPAAPVDVVAAPVPAAMHDTEPAIVAPAQTVAAALVPLAAATTAALTAAAASAPRRVAVAAVAPRERAAVVVDDRAAPDANPPAAIDKRDIAPGPPQRAVMLLRQANELAQAGQPRAALAQARDALTLDPALAAARLLAAVLEHQTGAPERAASLLREGLARDPRDAAQAMLLARVLIAQGDAAGALAALERHTVRGAEADGLRGGILTQQGEFGRALGAYESAARQQPTNSMWWLGLGVALDSEGQPQRARQAYARALTLGLPRDDLTQYADRRLRATD